MKKILVYLSPERHCSLFDIIVAYDAGADVAIPYSNVSPKDVRDIVHGCCFTRHPRDLVNTGIFVGGYDIEKAEKLASEALKVLDNLPKDLRVNIALDPNGAYTTASACVAKIKSSIWIKGSNVTVLAGTGPVGASTARLLAGMEANVTITSRSMERAGKIARELKSRNIFAFQADKPGKIADAVKNADVVVSAGPPGVGLMSRDVWVNNKRIKVLVDTNIVPPYGIEGIKPRDDGLLVEGKKCFGALAVGSLKMELHQRIIGKMFEEKGILLNLENMYDLYQSSLLR